MNKDHAAEALIILLAGTIIFVVALILSSCGPYKVDATLSGGSTNTLVIKPELSPDLFTPFFAVQCQLYTPGQPCYNANPAVCATCLSDALVASLSASPTPSPTP